MSIYLKEERTVCPSSFTAVTMTLHQRLCWLEYAKFCARLHPTGICQGYWKFFLTTMNNQFCLMSQGSLSNLTRYFRLLGFHIERFNSGVQCSRAFELRKCQPFRRTLWCLAPNYSVFLIAMVKTSTLKPSPAPHIHTQICCW